MTVQPEWDFSGNEEDCEVCRQGICHEDFDNPKPAPTAPVLDLDKLD